MVAIDPSEEQIERRVHNISERQDLKKRIARWQEFSHSLKEIPEIFWANPNLSIENTFESVAFEIENRKNWCFTISFLRKLFFKLMYFRKMRIHFFC